VLNFIENLTEQFVKGWFIDFLMSLIEKKIYCVSLKICTTNHGFDQHYGTVVSIIINKVTSGDILICRL
jgi:hypothetical protein